MGSFGGGGSVGEARGVADECGDVVAASEGLMEHKGSSTAGRPDKEDLHCDELRGIEEFLVRYFWGSRGMSVVSISRFRR